MHVFGLCLSHQFAWASATRYGVSGASEADLLSLDPPTALVTFDRWWQKERPEAVAVIWPTHPPDRYAGIYQYLAGQEGIYSIPVSNIKGMCGGASCTVFDVIRTARQLHPHAGITSYGKAAATLAAGLCASSHFG